MASEADTREHLRGLVKALDGAFISTWQTTAGWQRELDAAREYLSRIEDRPNDPHDDLTPGADNTDRAGAQEVPIVVDGRTEAEWCREACRVGAYDCVGPDGRHIRTFTGERTREKVVATIQGLKTQAERYDRAAGLAGTLNDQQEKP